MPDSQGASTAARRAWRYRRCPSCGGVFPGGDLRPLRLGEGHWHRRGGSLRRCPQCGHVDFTQGFAVVRERRAVVP